MAGGSYRPMRLIEDGWYGEKPLPWSHKFEKEYPGGVLWFVANESGASARRFAIDQLDILKKIRSQPCAMTRLWMNANKDYLLILDNLDDEEESEDFLPKEHKNYHLIEPQGNAFLCRLEPLVFR